MLQIRPQTVLLLLFLPLCAALLGCEDEDPGVSDLQGTGGSMARFALAKGHLYVANRNSIQVFQLENDGSLTKGSAFDAGFGIETIFATDQNLFMGAEEGMYVYDISEPAAPKYISRYSHILACDPVVVQGQYAYVTLRVSACRTSGFDALEVIDIKDLRYPSRISSYVTESPYGLGVDKNLLFLCQGDGGLKILDITDPRNIIEIKRYPSLHAYDVIPSNGVLLLTGNTGIFQYDYTDALNIRQLSHIPVEP
jgi:hypothetical protein